MFHDPIGEVNAVKAPHGVTFCVDSISFCILSYLLTIEIHDSALCRFLPSL